LHDIAVADVPYQQFDVLREKLGAVDLAVDLFDKSVEDPDLVAAGEKLGADRAANKPGAAGHENSFAQVAILLSNGNRQNRPILPAP
jgi:hypothetical protein